MPRVVVALYDVVRGLRDREGACLLQQTGAVAARCSGSLDSRASASSVATIADRSRNSRALSGVKRKPLPRSLVMTPSRSSVIRASRSGVRLTPSSVASCPSLIGELVAIVPLPRRLISSSLTCSRSLAVFDWHVRLPSPSVRSIIRYRKVTRYRRRRPG